MPYETIVEYHREFEWRGEPGSGFHFDCDEKGTPVLDNPCAAENFLNCAHGDFDVIDLGLKRRERKVKVCSCGSGHWPHAAYDARGIFVAYVCDKCEREKLSGYRPEIFTNSNYDHCEPISDDQDY